MKTICYCLTILLGLGMFATANNNPTKISAKEIELVSGDGKHTLTLAAQDNGVGLWVRNNDRKTYAYMYSGKIHGPNISLGNEGKLGDPLAFMLTQKGDEPMVQLRAGDKLKFVSGETMIDAAVEKAKAEAKKNPRVESCRRRGGCRPASSGGCSSSLGGCSSSSAPGPTTFRPPASTDSCQTSVSASGACQSNACPDGNCPAPAPTRRR
mgnify:CR=1 FL=1